MVWIARIAVLKVIKRVIQLIVAWIVAQNLGRFGVTIDPNQLTVAIFAGLELLRNWFKVRWKINWL